MSGRAWPSREEWQANAAYAVRTFCTMYERLDKAQPDTVWYSLAEDQEFEDLAFSAAGALRTLLTAEIDDLRRLLPDRPKTAHQRAQWSSQLSEEAYETAVNLGALEQIRTELRRARSAGNWASICWELGRLRDHYPAIRLSADLLKAHDRMLELRELADARRKAAAEAIEQSAVDREVARRATDEAWAKELERRAAIDHPRVIRVGQTSPSKGDQVT